MGSENLPQPDQSNYHNPENHANGYEAVTNEQQISSHNGHRHVTLLHPHSLLPTPVPPPQNDDVPLSSTSPAAGATFGSFLRQRSNNLSAAIAKRISSFSQPMEDDDESKKVTEFNLSGLKVVVKQKPEEEQENRVMVKGRISFFSRSNCRDSTAVRRFFREKRLRFVEINVDVFPEREKELKERTGSVSVPQIFFNEKLFGGLVALNSLRNSGEFERKLAEMVAEKCPDSAPAPPVYGFDYMEGEEQTDEMVAVVRVLRQKLPIQDRLKRLKIVKNCFAGTELVVVLVQHFGCARSEVRHRIPYA